ncbi:MAG TPA: ATP-grasp domain-containing protein [Gaiellaceae bacterium]|nr:ATP-grasp domain-containing protein [Gaiellaceae bacterium]
MREILVVCPQERDFKAIRAAGLEKRYRVRYAGGDLDRTDEFDAAAFLDRWEPAAGDGVVGTKDQSALLAALLAERRRLPGPAPEALLRCQHKPTARAIARGVVPEATPSFAVLERDVPLVPPFFVKPVVGRLSHNAFRVDNERDLPELPGPDHHTLRHAGIAALAGAGPGWATGFIAEELLTGAEVTLEGYVHEGRVRVIGATDSVKYPGTNSFERFEYPSTLPRARQEELAAVAARLVPALGLDGGLFNVEFFVPDEGPARVIEVNGRIASQFAPLVQHLHGRSTYDALFALAAGEDPRWVPERPAGAAVSYVLRVFEDAFVASVPDGEDGVEVLVEPGRRLSEQGVNDAESFRLAIVYEAAETRAEAAARARSRAEALAFRLDRNPG